MSRPAQRRALGALLCSLLMVVLGGVPAPARADSLGEVSIDLTSLAPAALGGTGDLVIEGTVTNSSGGDLRRVEVALWRDATPLVDLGDLRAALDDSTPSGAVMSTPTARQAVNDGGTFGAGEAQPFSVRASLAPEADEQLWLSQPGAAYQVGVEVYGSLPFGGYQLLGRATALLVYPPAQPVVTGTIVVLSNRPTLLPLPAEPGGGAEFVDESLTTELGGRLDTLLRLAERPNVLAVVDPALFDEVTALSGGHSVRQPDGTLVPGAAGAAEAASAWLARLQQVNRDGRLAVGLYGTPDVRAATASGRADVIAAADAAVPIGHPLAGLSTVVVPAGLQVDEPTVEALDAVAPRLVLATNLAGDTLVQSAPSGVRLVSVLDAASLTRSSGEVAARGLYEATQLLTAHAGVAPVSVATDARTAALAANRPAWQEQRNVYNLTADRTADEALSLAVPPEAAVPADLVAVSGTATTVLGAFGELTDNAEQTSAVLDRVLATGWSATFPDQAGQVAWVDRAIAPARAALAGGIELRISDWVTTSAEDNLLPVTVNNNSGYPINVRVHFESANPLRISVDNSDLFSVQPGESATVRVRPRTNGNGKTAIEAQLVTADGYPVGQPVGFVVTGTEAGRVAWLIIVASGVVLLVATGLRIRQVRRSGR